MRSRSAGAALLGLAVLASLSACSYSSGLAPADTVPTRAESVGVWQRAGSNAGITIYASGMITFSNIPKGVVDFGGSNQDGETKPVTVTGTWTSFSNAERYGPEARYTVDGISAQLWSEGNNTINRRLVLYYGADLQHAYYFHRIATKP